MGFERDCRGDQTGGEVLIRLGCVPYLNAKPLLWGFRERTDVEVILEVPSKLPALLDSGRVDAILVSSIEAIRRPELRVIPGIGIGSTGPVWSVRLFHRVALEAIQRLALDASSMTSNALALLLLKEVHGVQPETVMSPPDLAAMMRDADAGVLIGDRGMQTPPPGVEVWDLGEAWTNWTGLPFVWAVWLSHATAPQELESELVASARAGVADVSAVAVDAATNLGFTTEFAERYLREAIDFLFTDQHNAGFQRFRKELRQLSVVEA